MKRGRWIALTALAISASMLLPACTDAQFAKIAALGDEGRVTCYSGGVLRFDDFSTGKIADSEGSDGYYFMSRTTGKLVETSGDCTIQYGAPVPIGWKPTLP